MREHTRMKQKKKVIVALSGGVDSSVSAALLKEQGYEVEGAFIQTWTAPWLPCTWREERRDAMRVAAQLHIPFSTVNLSKEYEKEVVQYLLQEYKEGRTPNPDVMCNKQIKFGGFFNFAMERGFDYVATGHYARTRKKNGKTQLLAGLDEKKDQTYFLWTLTQKHLERTLFPIGAFKKKEVRDLAKKFGLITAQKKDSQGVCFLGKINMKAFLGHYIEPKKGNVLNTKREVIGTHDGAVFLTLGQRHGFTVTKKTPQTPPLFVVKKDVQANTITVAPKVARRKKEGSRIFLYDVNWIVKREYECLARFRYNQELFPVTVLDTDGECVVLPHSTQSYIAQGQSMVFYKEGVCLGGGVIGYM